MPPEVLSQESFYAQALEILNNLSVERTRPGSLEMSHLNKATIWELGFDSAGMVELVFFVEDLGVDLPDDLPWATLTLEHVYSIYLRIMVGSDLDGREGRNNH